MTDTVHDSFQQFVEAVVLPRMLENPHHARLDGWEEAKGNWEVAGLFRHESQVWKAHEDCRYEPLLFAYWSTRRGPELRALDTSGARQAPRQHRYRCLSRAVEPRIWGTFLRHRCEVRSKRTTARRVFYRRERI